MSMTTPDIPPQDHVAADARPQKADLWQFFVTLLPSVCLGLLLTPPMIGQESYLPVYGIQVLLALSLAFFGWWTNSRRRVNQAILMLWIAPFFWWFTVPLMEIVYRRL
jgi:hypothetical protein